MLTLLIYIAVILRIVSNPVGNLVQKQLTTTGTNPLMVNFITYFLLTILCPLLLIYTKPIHLTQSFWLYSILGGMVGALGNWLLIKALQKGDLSVLGPINSYKAVVGIIFGFLLLGETPNLWGMLGVLIILFGSYVVMGPKVSDNGFSQLKSPEIRYRVAAMILTAIEAVFVKKVINESTISIAFISWCVSGVIFSMALLFLHKLSLKKEFENIKPHDLKKYVLLVFCIGTMQISTSYTFDHMPVGYALSLFQLSSIVSIMLGYKVFREKGILMKTAGACVMIFGSILILLLKD